jgi:hypothetical protein
VPHMPEVPTTEPTTKVAQKGATALLCFVPLAFDFSLTRTLVFVRAFQPRPSAQRLRSLPSS